MDLERKVVLEKCVFNPTAAVFVPKALIPGSDIQRYREGFIKPSKVGRKVGVKAATQGSTIAPSRGGGKKSKIREENSKRIRKKRDKKEGEEKI